MQSRSVELNRVELIKGEMDSVELSCVEVMSSELS